MGRISNNIQRLTAALPAGVRLVAVSKFHPLEDVREAYDAGQRLFGESRADELAEKAAAMPPDTVWHFIGHLQSNKVRRVVGCASVIESVDSEKLLRQISNEAVRAGRRIGVFLQAHVAAETTKTGFDPGELIAAGRLAATLPAIRVMGVMGMATNTTDAARIEADFDAIAAIGAQLRVFVPEATEVSMGMSGDWPMAVERGATLVRIGTDIFGPRIFGPR